MISKNRVSICYSIFYQFFEKIYQILLTYLIKFSILYFVSKKWAHSSAGRASALQAGGHRFEPCCAHHFLRPGTGRHFFITIYFQNYKLNKSGSIAQLVEQGTENPRVGGSIPPRTTMRSSE